LGANRHRKTDPNTAMYFMKVRPLKEVSAFEQLGMDLPTSVHQRQ
jgi:hypothetical protein